MGIPRSATAYVLGLSSLTGYLLWHYSPQVHTTDWWLVLVLSVLMACSTFMKVQMGPVGQFGFIMGTLQFFTLLVAGVPAAAWIMLISQLAEGFLWGHQWQRVIFNASHHVLCVFVAGLVFTSLGGLTGYEFNHPLEALAGGVAFAAFILLNATALRFFLTGRPFHLLMQTTLRDMGYYVPLEILLAIATSYVVVHGGFIWASVVAGLVLLLHLAFHQFAKLYTDSEHRMNQMTAVLNATKSAIVMVDTDQTIRVANRKFGELVSTDASGLVGKPLPEVPDTTLGTLLASERQDVVDAGVDKVIEVKGPDQTRYFDWYRGPVVRREGIVEGTIEVLTDVTKEKVAEENLRQMHHAMLRALTAAIDARDAYTHGHSSRVSEYSVVIAKEMNLPAADIERIGYAGLLHDIGKLGIDDRVLRKHGPLTPNERAIMMTHPTIGAQILEKAGVFTELLPGVRWHHEWVNGGGYPEGLKGDQIPLDALIICVADAFDAMTSDRPYRRALSAEEALARLNTGKGVQFDIRAVEAFEAAYQDGRIVLMHHVPVPEGYSSEEIHEGSGTIRPVHGKELDIVYQVSKENYARLNLSAVLRRFLEIFYDSIGPNVYMIFLLDEASGELALHSSLGHTQEFGAIRLRKGDGVVGRAAETGKPVVVGDVEHSESYIAAVADTRAEIAVPLLFNGEVIGVLNVESGMPNAFSKDDVYLFEALAQQVSSAIELARYHERVAFAATHDGLTGVFNHNHFYERLTEEVLRAKRYTNEVSVVIFDLNGLKAVNDTYGHLAGDRALKEFADVLKASVREVDIVARYGGDEFAVIMPQTPKAKAHIVVERVLRAANRTFAIEGGAIQLPKAAWGVATFPEDAERATELVAVADQMMYANKPSRGSSRLSI